MSLTKARLAATGLTKISLNRLPKKRLQLSILSYQVTA
jgi:hypothetical protein